jgi:quinol monooxygenase YgiN
VILVLATYDMSPVDRWEFIASRQEQVKHAQSEPGCLEYRLCFDAFEPGRITLVERWRAMTDLQEHIKLVEARRADAGPEALSFSRTVLMFEGEPTEH